MTQAVRSGKDVTPHAQEISQAPAHKSVTRPSLLDDALFYYRGGWTVIPVKGKLFAGKSWKQYQTAPPTVELLRKLFSQRGITGLAVILGSASKGLACRDFDTGGSYERWAAQHPDLAAALPTVKTSRGYHLYFKGPDGYQEFEDGEYRADAKHYCLLPPSRHPDGPLYQWLNPIIRNGASQLLQLVPQVAGLLGAEMKQREPRGQRGQSETERTERIHESIGDCAAAGGAGEIDAEIAAAIVATLPTAPGQRHRKIFELARRLKGMDLDLGPGTLRPIIQEWHKRALPTITTKAFSETYADFGEALKKAKTPFGQGKIEELFEIARANQPPKKAVALFPDEPLMHLLAALCRELQHEAGDAAFYLDCRTAGRLLDDTPQTTAWRMLTALCQDGLLIAGEKGNFAIHKANRYHYVGGD